MPRPRIGAAFLALACASAACGTSPGGPCTINRDCPSAEICIAGRCQASVDRIEDAGEGLGAPDAGRLADTGAPGDVDSSAPEDVGSSSADAQVPDVPDVGPDSAVPDASVGGADTGIAGSDAALDASAPGDASSSLDAFALDAVALDAVAPDAFLLDARSPDAVAADVPPRDAEAADASALPDSATRDAAQPDSGARDAGGGCMTDPQCGAPAMVCEGGACVPGCGEIGGIVCTGMTMCEAASGRCVMVGPPPCADDAREENDTRQSAVAIAAGPTRGLVGCPGDEDWYAIALGAGDMLTADLSFQNAEGNLDAELLSPGGALVGASRSMTDMERVTYTAPAAGTYYLHVVLAADDGTIPGSAYDVTLAIVVPPPTCPADRDEENDTPAMATRAGSGLRINRTVCTGDDDYYALTANAGDDISLSITTNPSEGDIMISLHDQAGNMLAVSSGLLGIESLTYRATVSGTYLARVWLVSDAGSTFGNEYNMIIDIGPPPMCTADAFEPNNSAPAAAALAAGTYQSLRVCTGDEDWYAITPAATGSVTLEATFSTSEGDIDLYLYDASVAQLQSSTGTGGTERITRTLTANQTYYLRVYLYQDAGSTYGTAYTLVRR